MAQLSEKELALLSSLIYCDAMVKSQNKGKKVSEVVNYLLDTINDNSLTNEKKMDKIGDLKGDFGYFKKNPPEGKTGDQAALEKLKEVLEEVKGTALMDLTITSQKQNDSTTSAITAACFVDDQGAATVAFRGTDGSYKAWYDNFEGAGTTVATPMQEAAQKYIEGLEYENITVTGHSKGGNLAAYVTVVCDNVANGVSFDGQGFSEAFILQYGWVDASTIREETVEPNPPSATFKKGDIVKIKAGAKWYSGSSIPSWVMADTWIVYQDQVADRVVLNNNTSGKNAIMSPIHASDITKV